MLRINIMDSIHEVKFILYGRLCEPWIPELRAALLVKQQTLGDRKMVIDLRETTSVDDKGIELLSTMYDAGVKFRTSGVLMKYLMDNFRKKKKEKGSLASKVAGDG